MAHCAHRLLIVSDDPVLVAAVYEAVAERSDGERLDASCVPTLADSVARLGLEDTDAVLLDPFLPDSTGIDSFDEVLLAARRIPVLIVTSLQNEAIGRQAVRRGAADYVPTEDIGNSLRLALRQVFERVAVDNARFDARERASVTLDSLGDGVVSTDTWGYVTYMNPVAEKVTGWSHANARGQAFTDVFPLIDAATRQAAPNPMELALRERRTVSLPHHTLLLRRDGSACPVEDSTAPILNDQGEVTGAVMVFRDASAARVAEVNLAHLAEHDFLTGLPSRLLLHDRLDRAIELVQRHAPHMAVMFLDLERFKEVNDELGHAFGDRILQEVARRLTAAVRSSDTVSRRGGMSSSSCSPRLRTREMRRRKRKKSTQRCPPPTCWGVIP